MKMIERDPRGLCVAIGPRPSFMEYKTSSRIGTIPPCAAFKNDDGDLYTFLLKAPTRVPGPFGGLYGGDSIEILDQVFTAETPGYMWQGELTKPYRVVSIGPNAPRDAYNLLVPSEDSDYVDFFDCKTGVTKLPLPDAPVWIKELLAATVWSFLRDQGSYVK